MSVQCAATRTLVVATLALFAWLVPLGGSSGRSTCYGLPDTPTTPPTKEIDAGPLRAQPEPIARAMRANVMIESIGSGRRSVASGVILQLRAGVAYIATGRHVVDRGFTGALGPESPEPGTSAVLRVSSVDQVGAAAKVEWLAPHGIDLAIISAPLSSHEVREAHWDRDATPRAGDALFTIANPHGSGWARLAGSLSLIREQRQDDYDFQMMQSNLALQPGSSGGGLYDAQGRLIGINSMGGLVGTDKRFPAVGFSTSLRTLLDLAPKWLNLPSRNPSRS